MKKLLSIILILAMIFSFASCGGANKPLATKELEENVETTNKALDVRIKITGKEYVPGDTIFQGGFDNYNNYSVMVDGHLFKDFELSVADEGIVELKHNGAGVMKARNLFEGETQFSLKIDGQSYDFIWSNTLDDPSDREKQLARVVRAEKDNIEKQLLELGFDSPSYKEDFYDFLDIVNSNRLSIIRPDYNSANGYNAAMARKDLDYNITKQELDSIKFTGEEYSPKTISYEEACQDISLLFRSMRYGYAAYCYFGEDNFERAEASVMKQMEGKETISTDELAEMLYQSTRFINEAHFNIKGKRICNELSYRYEYYYSTLYFGKDSQGYYLTKNDEKWYYKSCENSNVQMQPYLKDDGDITYSLCQFCPVTVAHQTDKVVLTNNNDEETIEIGWILSEIYPKEDPLDYKFLKENGIAYVSIRSMEQEKYMTQLETYAADGAKIKDAKLIIYDLRANCGGSDKFSRFWVKNISGVEPRMSVISILWENYLWNDNKPCELGKESLDATKIEAKVIPNDIPVIVLVDDETGSSGESALRFARDLNNCLVIGSNSGGFQLCGNVLDFTLPYSKIPYSFCQGMNIGLDGKNVDGIGYAPDIWCNPKTALDAVINMLVKYDVVDSDSIKSLYTQIGHK